jgi:HAD superfamily hydrolase (TIGR01490 family)
MSDGHPLTPARPSNESGGSRIAALFDSDGTLYTNQMGRGMITYARAHGRRTAASRYYLTVLVGYLLRRLKLMTPLRFQEILISGMGWLVAGLSEAEGATVFDWVANSWLIPTERKDVAQRLQDHVVRGHVVMIISGSFSPCLELIGAHFGVGALIGTGLEVRDGHYTGQIIPPVITGKAKADCVRAYLSARNVEIDWDASFAYGDSITDAPMLELAGHPAAVYPDAKLAEMAAARGWEIAGVPKSNGGA